MFQRFGMLFFDYRRWLYLVSALVWSGAAWSIHDRACKDLGQACFHQLTLGPTYVLVCLGLLLLYGWKFFIERRTGQPMQLRLVGSRTPGVAVLLTGKHFVLSGAAWLAGSLIRTGL